MVNNPKFARVCNPLDTEFEVNICDDLAELFGIPEGFKILDASESDSLLSLLISALFSKRQGDLTASYKYIVYFSGNQERAVESELQ